MRIRGLIACFRDRMCWQQPLFMDTTVSPGDILMIKDLHNITRIKGQDYCFTELNDNKLNNRVESHHLDDRSHLGGTYTTWLQRPNSD